MTARPLVAEQAAASAPERDAEGRPVLRLGTRRSRLAMTQSEGVADLLRARGHRVQIVPVVTEGDVNLAPLTQIGGTGVFASALRQALLAGHIDLAVHSLKDLPVAGEPGLTIAAIPEREDARDALCARDGLTLAQLPLGARVGTGSPRRASQLRAHRPDLRLVAIRGNVETRLGRTEQDLDAVVLACSGLRRLGRQDRITELLPTSIMLPAPGQGALAVECRADDDMTVDLLSAIDDPLTRAATDAERALLAALEAGCTAPVGALATATDGSRLHLAAFVGTDSATRSWRGELTGSGQDPRRLGQQLAEHLLREGADALQTTGVHPHPSPGSAPTGARPGLQHPMTSTQ